MAVFAFFSGAGSNLLSVYNEEKRLEKIGERIHGKIVAAVTNNPNCPGVQRVSETDIPFYAAIDSRKFYKERGKDIKDRKTRYEYDEKVIEILESNALFPDLIIGVGWWRIWSDMFVEYYKNRIVHDHPADPFEYHGIYGIEVPREAIRRKATYMQPVVQFVTADGIDNGPVLVRSPPIEVLETDESQADILWERTKAQGDRRIFPYAVHQLFAKGRVGMGENGTVYIDGKPVPKEGYELCEEELRSAGL